MNSSEEQFKCRSIYLLFFFRKPMGKKYSSSLRQAQCLRCVFPYRKDLSKESC